MSVDLKRVQALDLARQAVWGEELLSKQELLWLGANPKQRDFLEALWASPIKWYDYEENKPTAELVAYARALVDDFVDDDLTIKWAYERTVRSVFGETPGSL